MLSASKGVNKMQINSNLISQSDYARLINIVYQLAHLKNKLGNNFAHPLNKEDCEIKRTYIQLEDKAATILNNVLNTYITDIIRQYKCKRHTVDTQSQILEDFRQCVDGSLFLYEEYALCMLFINTITIKFKLYRKSGKKIVSSHAICSLKEDTLILKYL